MPNSVVKQVVVCQRQSLSLLPSCHQALWRVAHRLRCARPQGRVRRPLPVVAWVLAPTRWQALALSLSLSLSLSASIVLMWMVEWWNY